jgi:hypothetical protein
MCEFVPPSFVLPASDMGNIILVSIEDGRSIEIKDIEK